MVNELSEKDIALLKILEDNCKPNYKHISEKLGISHTAVKKRVDKLIAEGDVSLKPLLNIEKLGFSLVLLFIEVSDENYIIMLLKKFKECPRIIHMFRVIGEYNIAVLAYAENKDILDSILSVCLLRTSRGVRKSLVIPVSRMLVNEYFKLSIPLGKLEKTPCGVDCTVCTR
ncbi:MAG: Lrp/AsnC family transcriptional regulator, partial [Thermoproteota archaeon]